MHASRVIEELQRLMAEQGGDPEVRAQSDGCCRHSHEIRRAEFDTEDGHPDEIVLRCG